MSYGRSRAPVLPGSAVVVRSVVAALLAGTALGVVLTQTGRLASVAALYGLDGVVIGWFLVYVHSVAACACFDVGHAYLAGNRYAPLPLRESIRNPFLGGCVGGCYGVTLWLAGVAYGLPLWFDLVGAGELPMPFQHGASLAALFAFGVVLGASYPILRVVVHEED